MVLHFWKLETWLWEQPQLSQIKFHCTSVQSNTWNSRVENGYDLHAPFPLFFVDFGCVCGGVHYLSQNPTCGITLGMLLLLYVLLTLKYLDVSLEGTLSYLSQICLLKCR